MDTGARTFWLWFVQRKALPLAFSGEPPKCHLEGWAHGLHNQQKGLHPVPAVRMRPEAVALIRGASSRPAGANCTCQGVLQERRRYEESWVSSRGHRSLLGSGPGRCALTSSPEDSGSRWKALSHLWVLTSFQEKRDCFVPPSLPPPCYIFPQQWIFAIVYIQGIQPHWEFRQLMKPQIPLQIFLIYLLSESGP